jgi:hypothetical protein
LSTRGGEVVKIGQNLVHVVVECPLTSIWFFWKKKKKNVASELIYPHCDNSRESRQNTTSKVMVWSPESSTLNLARF